MLPTAEYLIETADRCIRIASTGRRLANELDAMLCRQGKEQSFQLTAAGRELVDELEAVGRELLAKAVELDTERQKRRPGSFGP